MSATNIEWADRVWNPVTGCTKVSAGCKNCYAEGIAKRLWATQYPPVDPSLANGNGAPRPRRFTDVQTHEDRLLEPLKWRKPARIFVNSMSDLFHEDVPDAFIDCVFGVMALAPHHTFLVLTKRADRMRRYLASSARPDAVFDALYDARIAERFGRQADALMCRGMDRVESRGTHHAEWPLSNVHLGVSVENQSTADERIPELLQTPTAIRWVSYEPALGPVDFGNLRGGTFDALTGCGDRERLHEWEETPSLDWTVVGGESGHGARPFDIAWARRTVEQGKRAGVPVFVKQLGALPFEFVKDPGYHVDYAGDLRAFTMSLPKLESIGKAHGRIVHTICNQQIRNCKGGDQAEWPEDLRVRELPEVRA